MCVIKSDVECRDGIQIRALLGALWAQAKNDTSSCSCSYEKAIDDAMVVIKTISARREKEAEERGKEFGAICFKPGDCPYKPK